MTPRLNKEISQKLHDAGIVVESEHRYVQNFGLERPIPAPTLQELLMTKEANALGVVVGWSTLNDSLYTLNVNCDFEKHPDWQSATDYVGELLLKIRRR